MARILFAWELGKGFGHLAPYLELVRALRKRNHQVVFAARDVGNTERIFGADGVMILQAPIMMHPINNPYRVQYNFSHLMHNIGFAEVRSLFGLCKAWRHIYQYVRPDLVLFDHSPTAMLAAKTFPWKRIVSGSGFLIPPAEQPLPLMRYWQKYDEKKLAEEEAAVLANMNRVLEAFKVPPLKSVAQLYDADDQFLLSFKELDHYPARAGGSYLGMFSPPNHGVPPVWPANFERKVFAYLHPYKTIVPLIETLAQGKFCTIVYGAELPEALRKKYQSDKVIFSMQPLDVKRVAAECNFAITNGTFGTTAAFLLYGKPVFTIPTNLERVMVARRVVAIGAGIAVEPAKPEKLKPALRAMFSSDAYLAAARKFADTYRDADMNRQTEEMLTRIDRLLVSAGTAQSQPPVPPNPAPATPAPAPKTSQRPSRRSKRK